MSTEPQMTNEQLTACTQAALAVATAAEPSHPDLRQLYWRERVEPKLREDLARRIANVTNVHVGVVMSKLHLTWALSGSRPVTDVGLIAECFGARPLIQCRVDGDARAYALIVYTSAQRESGRRVGSGMTETDRKRGSEEWSAQLRTKVAASKAESARREYQSLAVDDDRWEID